MPQLSITAFTKAVPAIAGQKRQAHEIDEYDSDEIKVASPIVRPALQNISPTQAHNKRVRVLDCVLIPVDKRTSNQSPAIASVSSVRSVSLATPAQPTKARSRPKRTSSRPILEESSEDELSVPTAKPRRKALASKAKATSVEESEFEDATGAESEDFIEDGVVSDSNNSIMSLDGDSDEHVTTTGKKSKTPTRKAAAATQDKKSVSTGAKNKSKASKSKDMKNLCKIGGLDLSLPPLHNIDAIFDDIAQKALSNGFENVLQHLSGRKLRVATMCSGTESPLLALELIRTALKHHSNIGLEIDHAFSAEIVPFKQAYIERNFNPPLIFRDITELIESVKDAVPMATTAYGGQAPVPTDIHMLIAGTSCVDLSNLNNNKKTLDEDGESAKTWKAVLAFCEAHKPPIVILENVKNGAPWDRMLREYRDIGYETAGVHIDAKNYCVPQTRQRGYMVCFDKHRLEEAGLQPLGEKWQSLMEKFQRQVSSPVSSFLLPADLLSTRDVNLTDETRREVDWVKCAESHVRYRQDKRLGNARPFTQWQESGSLVVPENGSASWYHGQVERVFDFMDCSLLRKAPDYDARHKTRVWNVSQNIHMEEDNGPFGIIGCITPTGQFFLSDAGRVLSAEELLILQAIPLSKISFTTETPKEMQDLAGNAMTATVVASAMLSALITGHKLLTEFSDADHPRAIQQAAPRTVITSAVAKTMQISSGEEDVDVSSLLEIASRAIRRCFCEGARATSKKGLQRCLDCGHTTCIACGGSPEHNYRQDQALSQGRILPQEAESSIREQLPLRLKFGGSLDLDILHEKLEDSTSLEGYIGLVGAATEDVFSIERFRRSHGLTITYQSASGRSHLDLALNDGCAEWHLFVHAPPELPANSPLRAALQQPVAKADISRSLFDSTWLWRNPVTKEISTTILGHGGQRPTMRARIELPDYRQERQPQSLTVEIFDKVRDADATILEGTYHYLPRCGTAYESLYRRTHDSATKRPIFLFLDSSRVGSSKDDCFVFSENAEALDYGETRETIATVKASWRPWDHGQSTRTVSIAWNAKWINLGTPNRLESLPTAIEVREATDHGLNEIGQTCGRLTELITCNHNDHHSSPAARYELVSQDNGDFASRNGWLFEAMRRQLHGESWHALDHAGSEKRCETCAPEKPKLRWKLGNDGDSLQPYEDPNSASQYERWIKHRPAAVAVEARFTEDEQRTASQIRLAVDLQSMAHRVKARLPQNGEPLQLTWRLSTEFSPSSGFTFRPLKLKPNPNIEPCDDDLGMSIKLFPKQRQSLAWIKQQESGSGKQHLIEESEEERVPSLGWTLEMRAQVPISVRGGICADHPGYGKTILSIALIKSQFKDATPSSVLSDLRRRQNEITKHLIASTATLVICPRTLVDQWVGEARDKGGLKLGTDVFSLKTMADLDKKTVAQLSNAKLIVVSSALLGSEAYTERLAAFAGVPGPVATKGRPYEQWLEFATKEVPEHVRIMQQSGRHELQRHVKAKYLANINSDEFQATVPSRRLKGRDYAAAQKSKPKSKTSTTKVAAATSLDTASVGIPLLEWYYFNRIICDEFHDYDAKQMAVIKSLKKDKIWGLSGTPAIGDFYDVKKIAELLGVPLPLGSDSRAVLKQKSVKELRKDMTAFERFDSHARQVPSASILSRINELYQNFLDNFVTRNVTDFQMNFEDHLIPVTLDLDHQADYIEVSQHLNSIDMRLKKGSKSKTTDREGRIYDAIATSESAEQALSKRAAFFERKSLNATSVSAGLGGRIEQRHAEMLNLKVEIRAAILQAEKHESVVFEQWRLGRVHVDVLGDIETVVAIRERCSNSDQISKQIAATKDGTKEDRSMGLTSSVHNLVNRLLVSTRSLRYLRNILQIQEAAVRPKQRPLCSNTDCQSSAGEEIAVSAFCGHIVCSSCYEHMKDAMDTQCPANGCTASTRDHHLLWTSKMGSLQDPNLSVYGAKIDAAIKLLKDFEGRGDQAVLFVQYENQLNEVSRALETNGITATVLDSATADSRKIEEFKSGDTTVIVLNASDETATGLNLQNANHVIFMSPLLRTQQYSYDATMAQAIGRVRRHGQQKQIHVYRIVALDTIDVDILEHRERRTSALAEYDAPDIAPPSAVSQGHVIAEPQPERTQFVRENGVFSLRPQSWLVRCGADRDEDELEKIRSGEGNDRKDREQKVKMKGRVLGWESFCSLVKFSRMYLEDDD